MDKISIEMDFFEILTCYSSAKQIFSFQERNKESVPYPFLVFFGNIKEKKKQVWGWRQPVGCTPVLSVASRREVWGEPGGYLQWRRRRSYSPSPFYIHLYIFLFLFLDVRTHIEISTLQVLISLSRLRKSPFNQLSIFAYFKSGRILGIRDIIGHLAWKISASATKQDLWFIYLR